jgi:hypothetical protein
VESRQDIARELELHPTFKLRNPHLPTQESIRLIGATGEPAFKNSWVNFGSTYGSAGYYKDGFGRVHLSGVIKSGTAASVAFTLPVGYRPANDCWFVVPEASQLVVAQVDVQADGDVVVTVSTSNSKVGLDGISFRAL